MRREVSAGENPASGGGNEANERVEKRSSVVVGVPARVNYC